MSWMTHFDTLLSESTITEACGALRSLTNQLSAQPEISACILERLFYPKASGFLVRLKANGKNEEFLLCALKCIDDTLELQYENCRDNIPAKQLEAFEAIGETLLQMLYQSRTQLSLVAKNVFALKILSILSKISTCSTNYLRLHISELLGIAKAHVNFGLFNLECTASIQMKPVQPCHQLTLYSSDEPEAEHIETQKARSAGGGKVSKKRKPRSIAKSSTHSPNQQQQWRTLDLHNIVADMKTSDSDASDLETGLTNTQRQNRAKVRQAAINLMGIIATKIKDRRVLYAYWYGFFENVEHANSNRSDLLNAALHDPNTRCRSLALQVAAQLIFNSKSFLQQAECIQQRCPTTFTHFAHDLGLLVLSLFEQLIQILACESSISVLTQALKCVAVLVQATTPFKRFQPRSFVLNLVKEVRRLTAHRDATIQVAALMVMEFLIAGPELTPEISQAIGMQHMTPFSSKNRVIDQSATDLLEIDNSFEEILESDCEEETTNTPNANERNVTVPPTSEELSSTVTQMSWLLQIICNLHNSNIGATSYPPVSVRIESLQLLAAMAQHFHLLHYHLDLVATCIENSLKDASIDLRLCAARTVDTIAHQIGRTLLETVAATSNDVVVASKARYFETFEKESLQFWARLLPVLMAQINSMSTADQQTSLRVCLCDALSNIGLIVFERQTFNSQMNLIGFLSGIANDPNEEVTLRIAAVRALAVYVLFPSLRENLVFVENLAESALRLSADTNLIVRIKALWALGNISDALLIQCNNSHERVSDTLLWQMIVTTTDACSDNDKVRCNAVRALGNFLRLLSLSNLEAPFDGKTKLQVAISKLNDCLRLTGSAKVKWNTCYAIGNFLQNSTLFHRQENSSNFDWQSKIFPTLANVIVHHNNFKVRINAATALTRVTERSHFGAHFEILCKALLDALEQSQNLDNFYEYNHRDQLQEQLCLAICHLLKLSSPDDFLIFRKYLESRLEVVHNINVRVLNRMVPEKSKGILACTAFLEQQLQTHQINYTNEQKNAIKSILKAFDNQ